MAETRCKRGFQSHVMCDCEPAHPLTPREAVEYWLDLALTTGANKQDFNMSEAVSGLLAALASGSGDHAELARLKAAMSKSNDEICQSLGKALGYPWFKDDQRNFPGATEENGVCVGEHVAESIADDAASRISALLAEIAALRGANYIQSQDMITSDARATEAERKLAEAVEAMEEIAAIEPKPFEGGLDMEAIRACEECRRYEGHPVQHGICNTHRRPIWDREKHEGHEEKALGYRAKSIARTFLSEEAERG